jgi:hypothetical protein
MLKKILILVVLIALGKTAVQSFSAKNIEQNMAKIMAEINGKLPRTEGNMRLEKVEYANHVIRYSGTVLGGQGLSGEMKNDFEKQMKTIYCQNTEFKKANVSVEFSLRSLIMKNINDKLSDETWVTGFHPNNCT